MNKLFAVAYCCFTTDISFILQRRTGKHPIRQRVKNIFRSILRLICTCDHTHAILPDFIIPYSSYGLFFLLRVLAEYFLHLSTVERLCERFSISLSQLRRWLELFRVQKVEWLGILSSVEISALSFLKALSIQPAYSDFASAFVHRFAKSFLQSHRNPVPYCQQVFGL